MNHLLGNRFAFFIMRGTGERKHAEANDCNKERESGSRKNKTKRGILKGM
jgi:hypothetical protein